MKSEIYQDRFLNIKEPNKYWLLDGPRREINADSCFCCEIELPMAKIRLNAIDDYDNFCTLGFSREDYEKLKSTVWTGKVIADQQTKARGFRLEKMRRRT